MRAMIVQQSLEIHLVHRPQRRRLHAHRARAHQRHRVLIHRLHIAASLSARRRLCALGQQQGGQALGMALHASRTIRRYQRRLPTQQRLDACTQGRPVRLIQIEVAAQVQQRALPDLAADAFRAHQPVGEIAFTGVGVTRLSAADEHGKGR